MNKFLLIFFFAPLFCLGQKQGSIWYFGNEAGLNFNSGSPIVLTDGQTYSPNGTNVEGTSVISDSTGALLFYTNGMEVWNKNHQVMPNGNGLLGNFSSTQSSLIVAQPGSSRYFYIFTTDDFYEDGLQYGFRYSVVDICFDNGLGDVLSDQKNIKLLDTVAEKLTAVKHINGNDFWIIVHKYYSDAFYSYHLSPLGIVDTVISHVGSVHPTTMIGLGGAIGQLKVSPNGNKLAIVNGQSAPNIAEYFDFDKNTGIVSNCVSIQTNPNYSYYGVSFSPDNSKLYISCWLNNNGIYQFNLSASGGNPDSVIASKTLISNLTSYAMQLAPNGKIYLATVANPSNYLSVINNPNNLGINCNYQDSAVYLNGKTCSGSLPNFIDSYDYTNTDFKCITVGIENEKDSAKVSISPNPFSIQAIIQTERTLKNATLIVLNSLGEQIKQIKNIDGQTITVYKENLSSGLYFVQLLQDNRTLSINKLVIIEN